MNILYWLLGSNTSIAFLLHGEQIILYHKLYLHSSVLKCTMAASGGQFYYYTCI